MEKKNYNQENDEMEIDLLALLLAMKKKLGIILLAGIIGFGVMFLYTRYLVTPLYSATAMMYVLPDNSSNGYNSTLSDMQVGQQLTNDYASMIKSRTFMEEVIKKLKLDMDYKELLEYVSVSSPSDSRILQITVNNPDPKTAMDIANEVAEVAEDKLADITSMQATKIYEWAEMPTEPSSPSFKKNCALGALAGIVLAMAVIAFIFIMDDTIKTEEDVEKYLNMTTLAVIPYSSKKSKRNSKKKSKKKKQTAKRRKEKVANEFN